MPAITYPGSIKLTDVPPLDSIYLGLDQDGGLLFRADISLQSYEQRPLTERHLVAMGLTELCCREGEGMVTRLSLSSKRLCAHYVNQVYWFPVHETVGFGEHRDSVDKYKCVNALYKLPKLVYVPFVWAEKDKKNWWAMSQQCMYEVPLVLYQPAISTFLVPQDDGPLGYKD